MQAYKYDDLYASYVDEQAKDARQASCIDPGSYQAILKKYVSKLYTPNYFIRIALGFLTIVAVLFTGLLLFLLFSASGQAAMITLFIFLAVLCYAALELVVQAKAYYNAGVDNILMALVPVFAISPFFITDFEPSWISMSGVAMIVSIWLSLRFTDAFMAMVAYACLFIFFFLLYLKFGDLAKSTAPFVMMTFSALAYFLAKKIIDSTGFRYRFCFNTIVFLSLVTFYASGNYFVVKELSNQMFHLELSLRDPIPLGWVFWMFTVIIPPGYIIYGIVKKDVLVMRTGLGLIAAIIFTVKYYYAVLPLEMEMLLAGIILIGLSYALIRYLRIPKYGFTSADLYPSVKEALNIESLIIAETLNQQAATGSSGLYGGGTGGGGGATGEF